MERESKEGVWITTISKAQWHKRVKTLRGEDLQEFICKCNPAKFVTNSMEFITGMRKEPFYDFCKEIDPEFNPETDYFVIRYAPSHELLNQMT